MFTKLSVLLFYKRIFQIRKAFRILHWVMVTIVVTSSIAFLFALICKFAYYSEKRCANDQS